MLAFFCLGARYRPWRYSAAVRSRVFGDGATPRRTPLLAPAAPALCLSCFWRGRSPSPAFGAVFLRGGRQLFGAGRIQALVHGKIFANAFSGVRSWQDYALMRSRALDDGKMPAKCVSQRPTVAGLRTDALLA